MRRLGALRATAVLVVLAAAGCATLPSPSATDVFPSASAPTSATPHPFADLDAWIAYQTDRAGQEGVWLIRPDGTDDHEVAAAVPGEHLHPNWSPDGSRLVFTSRGEKDLLYELDMETGQSRPLWDCADPCLGDDEAVYSPDGDGIAFIRALGPIVNDLPADCAIWIGDSVTGTVQQITSTPGCSHRETFPHWSRLGTQLAYYRGTYDAGGTTTATALYVLDLPTGAEVQFTDDAMFAGDSDWSASDEWLVFSTYPLNDFQCCQVSNLYLVRSNGEELQQLTHYGTGDVRATQPRVTPDGRWILFTAVTEASRELWVIPFEGGDPILVKRGGIYTHGAWQPT